MQIRQFLTGRNVAIAAGMVVIAFAAWSVVFETVTRRLVATDAVCTYCHLEWEFSPTARLTASRPHNATPAGGQAACVDCHLPPGYFNAANAYLHFVSLTDLFGHVRHIAAEREGTWTPPRAKTAYRVRDRLQESNSVTCRTCHIEAEIKPKRERGVNAHKLALDEKKTCIECHFNLVHRSVDLRNTAAQK